MFKRDLRLLTISGWDITSYKETWADYTKQLISSALVEGFNNITSPITMIDGKEDPIPYEGLLNSLNQKNLSPKVHLLEKCGHIPWIEPSAQQKFFQVLIQEVQN